MERERAEVEQAKRKVNEAAIDVMKAELPIGEMLVRAERLQAELIAARAALCWLSSSRCIGDAHIKRAEHLLRDHDLPVALEPQFIDFDGHPSAVVWRNAIERLRTNAEAKLPMI